MTGELLAEVGVPLGICFLTLGLGIFLLLRRACRIKSRLTALDIEHDRLLLHAQARLAAQKEQLAAEAAAGEARLAHLRQAIRLYREANRLRPPTDEATYRFLCAQIALLEDHLRAAGADPEEEPTAP